MCELTAGYTKSTCASYGGTKSVVVYNTENLDTATVASNVVSALSLTSPSVGFRVSPDMASIDFTETPTRSRENNSIFYASTCAITIKEDSQESRDFIDLIMRGFVTVIQEKENGKNLVYGLYNGMVGDTTAITTGLNYEDLNGAVINLVGKEASIAPSIDDTIIASVL